MPLHRLSSIEVGIPDASLAESLAFYRDLGLQESSPRRFSTRDGGEQLTIVEANQRGLAALTVGVDDADDLGRVRAALVKLGVAPEHEGNALRMREPITGIRVTLEVQPRLTQKAGPRLETNGPGHVARRNSRSAVVLTKESPRPRKLSHVVATSPDPAATRRFFTEGLGFQVSDEIPALGASFMRCSTDHHNLLIQQAPVSILHHVAWEMDDVDAVGRAAAARVAANPACHVWGLGRHAIGSNYFWYLRDPAGNFHEYTADLDVIDDAEAWRVAASGPAEIAVWGPPVPNQFLLPEDLAALMQESAR